MRVLSIGNMYPPHHLGGYELVWEAATTALRDAGHQVRILTSDVRFSGGPQAAGSEQPDVHRDLRWYWHEHRFPRLGLRARLALERHNQGVLRRELSDLRPDVVTWWAMGGMSLSLIGQVAVAGLPAVAFVNDDWIVYGSQVDAWTRTFARHARLGRLVAAATGIPTRLDPGAVRHWVFCSEFVRQTAVRAEPAIRSTSVAPSGVSELFLKPGRPPREWAGRLLYVGRIDPRKGIDVAVAALALLPEPARLTVVGGGDDAERARLAEQVRRLGLERRVEMLGPRPREALRELYEAADAVVFPVRWAEPFGLVPLEAMGVGRPVLATGRGGSADYLVDGENCLLFDPDEPATLAAAVQRLGGEPELRERLVAGGARTAPRYSEPRYNEAVRGAVESLMSSQG
jgi:glycosyltransferase involved in cell wall biosynthesis